MDRPPEWQHRAPSQWNGSPEQNLWDYCNNVPFIERRQGAQGEAFVCTLCNAHITLGHLWSKQHAKHTCAANLQWYVQPWMREYMPHSIEALNLNQWLDVPYPGDRRPAAPAGWEEPAPPADPPVAAQRPWVHRRRSNGPCRRVLAGSWSSAQAPHGRWVEAPPRPGSAGRRESVGLRTRSAPAGPPCAEVASWECARQGAQLARQREVPSGPMVVGRLPEGLPEAVALPNQPALLGAGRQGRGPPATG